MLPLPKFIKPWKDAGEANALFAPCAFIDEHVFLTKTGALGVVFELAGIDSQCLTDATMDSNTKRLAAAWRIFHEDIRLYQYVVKHDGAGIDQQTQYDSPAVHRTVSNRREFLEQKGLYSIRLYLAVVLEPGAVGKKAASSFLNKKALRILTRELEENRERLLAQTQAFERSIGDLIGLRLLPKADAFQFFRVLANLDRETAADADTSP